MGGERRAESGCGVMTGWNLCKQCRAVTWKDAVGRTFGCAIGCSNARTHNETNANPKPKIAGVERANDTIQPSGPPINMPYSPDTRGDCRPQWTGEGTGNFTIPQSVRFPPRKRRPGEDLQYDTSGTIGARKEPASTAFKDQIKRNQIESFNPPPAVGPSTYLRHRMGEVEGDEYKKTYSAGVMMRATAARDIYGAGGMANLRSQCSPTNTNAYFAHDSKKRVEEAARTESVALGIEREQLWYICKVQKASIKNTVTRSIPRPTQWASVVCTEKTMLHGPGSEPEAINLCSIPPIHDWVIALGSGSGAVFSAIILAILGSINPKATEVPN